MIKAYNITGKRVAQDVVCAVCGNKAQHSLYPSTMFKLVGARPRANTYVHGRCIHPDSLAAYMHAALQAEAEYFARRDADEDKRQGLVR